MIDYDPADWYWIIGGDATQTFSSKQNAFVGSSDPKYVAWLSTGHTATRIDTMASLQGVLTRAEIPPYAPVTPLQARKALRQAGLITQVSAAVAAATPDVQDAWDYASVIKRTDPMVTALGASLNLTSAALDHLFILAATL